MAPPRRTEPQGVRTEQILAAARKVFREKGYDRTTVSDIVREAGIAQGTFYLYFPSKGEAFLALSQQFRQMLAESIREAYDFSLSFEDRNRAAVKACFQRARNNVDLVRLIHFGADSLSAEVQAALRRDSPILGFRTQALKREMEAGEIEPVDPEVTARLLYGMMMNALIEAFVFGDEGDAERLEEGSAQMIINLLKPRT